MKTHRKYLFATLLFAFFATLISVVDFFAPCYLENRGTFVYEADFVRSALLQIGGLGKLISSFIAQFFTFPVIGIIVTAALLTLIAWLFGTPLVPIALAFLLFAIENYFPYIVAFVALGILIRFEPEKFRIPFRCISTVFLFFGFGSVATLYLVALTVKSVFCSEDKPICLIPAFALFFAVITVSVNIGLCATVSQALTPLGYIPPFTDFRFLIWIPWIVFVVEYVVSILLRGKRSVLLISEIVASAVLTTVLSFTSIPESVSLYKKLECHSVRGEWDKIISICEKNRQSLNSGLFQNYLNLALAQRGFLIDRMFRYGMNNEICLCLPSDKSPFVGGVASDIFYACGLVANSQRHAFEANENYGGYSPRCLKRLIETNTVLGYPEVAGKYLSILRHTLFYRKWKPDVYAMMDCAGIKNGFCGLTNNFDMELLNSLEAHSPNPIAVQYLFSDVLVRQDISGFKKALSFCWERGMLADPLPVQLQQAVVTFASQDPEILGRYHIPETMVLELSKFLQAPSRYKGSVWYWLVKKTD